VVAPAATARETRRRLLEAAAPGKPKFVVLIGDGNPPVAPGRSDRPPPAESRRDRRTNLVPTFHLPTTIIRRYGGGPQLASDSPYGDFDADGLPDAAVGRLPADSPAELRRLVARTIQYETKADHSTWRRRLHFVAGVGNFGVVADTVLESTTRRFVTDLVPSAYRTTITQASWRSPYCPDPRRIRTAAIDRYNQGGLFWIYLGHGERRELDRVRTSAGTYPIFQSGDESHLKPAAGSPMAVMLCCYAGAFDDPRDCLAEQMLRAEGGPVAVLAGSRVTMPYGLAVLGLGMLKETFPDGGPAAKLAAGDRGNRMPAAGTLGEIVLRAKRRLGSKAGRDRHRILLDGMAAAISPHGKELAAERMEHILLMNLLGDPLLEIRRPKPLVIAAPARAVAGEAVLVRGQAPFAGRCVIELVCRRDRTTFRPPLRRKFPGTDEDLRAMDQVYARAIDDRYVHATKAVAPGPFRAVLRVPAAARGPCHVRVFIEGKSSFAAGATEIVIQSAAE